MQTTNPLHFPTAHVTDPRYQPACEIGPGFRYWSVTLPLPIGVVGIFRSEASARRVAAAYRDPNATPQSIEAAWAASEH